MVSTEIGTHVQHTASIMSLFVCMYNACAHTYIAVDLLTCGKIMRAAFTTYWHELAETCSDISRVVGFRDVARF